MRTTFLRTLAAVAVVQFAITRTMAGRAIEDGRAERLWMMYPANVAANTIAWMFVFVAFSRLRRIIRPA